jgi:hypothetical protein
MRGFQTSYLLILGLIYFTFATKSVPMFAMTNGKAEGPRVVCTSEVKLKIIADFEAGQ